MTFQPETTSFLGYPTRSFPIPSFNILGSFVFLVTLRKTERQTNRQTDRQTEANILPTPTDSVGEGNNSLVVNELKAILSLYEVRADRASGCTVSCRVRRNCNSAMLFAKRMSTFFCVLYSSYVGEFLPHYYIYTGLVIYAFSRHVVWHNTFSLL